MLHLILLLLTIIVVCVVFIRCIVIPYLIGLDARYYDEDKDEFIL